MPTTLIFANFVSASLYLLSWAGLGSGKDPASLNFDLSKTVGKHHGCIRTTATEVETVDWLLITLVTTLGTAYLVDRAGVIMIETTSVI